MRKSPSLVVLGLTAFSVSSYVVAASAKGSPAAPVPVSPVKIEFSHLLDEERAERLEPLIERFNSQQKDAHVTLVRRVSGEAPKQLNLVTPDEQARFAAHKAKFKPLHEVMKAAKEPFDASKLSPELRDGLTDSKGQLQALPFAFSTPVLYINKAAFRKAGLDPEKPPRTWLEMQEMAGQLFVSGERCPFTTSWPVWIFLDNMSAWSGVEVGDAKGQPAFNGLVQVKHVAMMSSWYKAKYFHTFGHRDEADRRFANGECAMLTSSSALYSSLSESKTIDAGVSALPYHDDVYGAPKNTLADGASLWVSGDLKPAEAKGVARFVNFLLGPEVQINMTAVGGFLPLTSVARATAASRALQSDLAALKVAFGQLQGKTGLPKLRLAQIEPVRTILEDELDAVWANRKPAKEALDSAVMRANSALRLLTSDGSGRRGK